MRVVYTCARGHRQALTFDPSFSLDYVLRFIELQNWMHNESPHPVGCGLCDVAGEFSSVHVELDAASIPPKAPDTDPAELRPTSTGEEPEEVETEEFAPIHFTQDEYGNTQGTQRFRKVHVVCAVCNAPVTLYRVSSNPDHVAEEDRRCEAHRGQ